MRRHCTIVFFVVSFFVLLGCGNKKNYENYLNHMPKSILVLPPLNTSVAVGAADSFLSTVSRPLAESGYYVFPIAVVDQMMKENGLPTAAEMHRVPLKKIDDIFGADTVLYINISRWGASYQVFNNQTAVAMQYRLVDVKTGTVLWSHSGHAEKNSNNGNNGLAGALIGAIVTKVIEDALDADYSPGLSANVNKQSFLNKRNGLLKGKYHPKYEEDQKRRWQQQRELTSSQ